MDPSLSTQAPPLPHLRVLPAPSPSPLPPPALGPRPQPPPGLAPPTSASHGVSCCPSGVSCCPSVYLPPRTPPSHQAVVRLSKRWSHGLRALARLCPRGSERLGREWARTCVWTEGLGFLTLQVGSGQSAWRLRGRPPRRAPPLLLPHLVNQASIYAPYVCVISRFVCFSL